MSITFPTKYPSALKNAAWQKSKSFKDKTKSKTKTGLGDALVLAEKNWGKLKFNNLIAAKQGLHGKSLVEQRTATGQARAYLEGPEMLAAIHALEAAASLAKTTGKNPALSSTAAKAATTLSGALLRQAKLLHDIKLDDFAAEQKAMTRSVHDWEVEHTATLHTMDAIRDNLRDSPDQKTWQTARISVALTRAHEITETLSTETGDQHWTDMHGRWGKLLNAYNSTDAEVKSGRGGAREINEFADLVNDTLGGVWA